MTSTDKLVSLDLQARVNQLQDLQEHLSQLSHEIDSYEQPKTESGMESLTKKKISEEVESIRLEKIDDFRSNLQSRDGDKRVFHVKIVNTVLSIDNIDDDVTSKAHPRNLGKGNALDTKSGEARDSPHSRSSTFQVTGGLTIQELLRSSALFWWIEKGIIDNLVLTNEAGHVWPLTTRVQDILEGRSSRVSRVACVLHLMEKTTSGSEASMHHDAPSSSVLPASDAPPVTIEKAPEYAQLDKLSLMYRDIKRAHIHSNVKSDRASTMIYLRELATSGPNVLFLIWLLVVWYVSVSNDNFVMGEHAYYMEKGLRHRLLTPYFVGTRLEPKWEAFDTITTRKGIEEFFLRGVLSEDNDGRSTLLTGSGKTSCPAGTAKVGSTANSTGSKWKAYTTKPQELVALPGDICTAERQNECRILNRQPCRVGTDSNMCGACMDGFKEVKGACKQQYCDDTSWVNNKAGNKFLADCSLARKHREQCNIYDWTNGFQGGWVECDALQDAYVAQPAREIVCEAPAAEEYELTNPQDRRMLKFSVGLKCSKGAVPTAAEAQASRCTADDNVFKVRGCRKPRPLSPFEKMLFPTTQSTPQSGAEKHQIGTLVPDFNYMPPEWFVADDRATGYTCNMDENQLASNQIIGKIRIWKKIREPNPLCEYNASLQNYTYLKEETEFEVSEHAVPSHVYGDDGFAYSTKAYVRDVALSLKDIESTFVTLFRNEGKAVFMDYCTHAIGVSIVFFNTNFRRFSTVTLLLEFPMSGQIKTNVHIETISFYGAYDKLEPFLLPWFFVAALLPLILVDLWKYYVHFNLLRGSVRHGDVIVDNIKKKEGLRGYVRLMCRVHRYACRHLCFEHNCAVFDLLSVVSSIALCITATMITNIVHQLKVVAEQRDGTDFLNFDYMDTSMDLQELERCLGLFLSLSLVFATFRVFILVWQILRPMSPQLGLQFKTFICSFIQVMGAVCWMVGVLFCLSLLVHLLLGPQNMVHMRFIAASFYRVLVQCIGMASFTFDTTDSPHLEIVKFALVTCMVATTRIAAIFLATIFFSRAWQQLRTKEFKPQLKRNAERDRVAEVTEEYKDHYNGTFRNGLCMPQIGLLLTNHETVAEEVNAALSSGCKRISLPPMYSHLLGVVGETLKDFFEANPDSREEIWITGSFTPQVGESGYQQALNACAALLEGAQVSYLDLLVVEQADEMLDRVAVWRGMQTLLSMRSVRSIGVCGYKLGEVEQLLHHCQVPPDVAQLNLVPLDSRPLMIERLMAWHIHIEHNDSAEMDAVTVRDGYDPDALAVVHAMAAKYELSLTQLFRQWHLQSGFAVSCVESDLPRCFEQQGQEILSQEEMRILDYGLW